jgi:hypothetical protein
MRFGPRRRSAWDRRGRAGSLTKHGPPKSSARFKRAFARRHSGRERDRRSPARRLLNNQLWTGIYLSCAIGLLDLRDQVVDVFSGGFVKRL